MALAGCLRPVVILHIQLLRKIDELLRNPLDELSRGNACFRCGLLDLLAVLIDTGEEKHIFTFQPVIARDHIGQHHLVSVPDMRRRVRVIDRSSDEKRLRHFCVHL